MDFEWIVNRKFENLRAKNYINPCCVGGDEILEQLKPEIAAQMNADKCSMTIYQEDWGWALEFSKKEIDYLLAVYNSSEIETAETVFSAYTQATRRERGLLFYKRTDAEDELENFSQIVSISAEKNGFK